ncbi:MAG: phosphoribosylformylglycinamidine synthase [Victivallales bacterium]|nr:phosphoribosylformylglycinamidine synthase [Victivallales bacterium]
MSQVFRAYVEKRPGFDVEAKNLLSDLRETLGIASLEGLRILKRYDLAGLTEPEFQAATASVLSEPNCDEVTLENYPQVADTQWFAVEYLPGQYDQRADSAAQCIQLLTQKEKPLVRTATLYGLQGKVSADEVARIKSYLINPVESRECVLGEKPATLEIETTVPEDVKTMAGFLELTPEGIAALDKELGLAMSAEDLAFVQSYFRDQEKREPTFTEIKVIDTYWSDHCRHTTFHTSLDQVEFPKDSTLAAPIQSSYQEYLEVRKRLGRENKTLCLMDIGTIGAKELKRQGKLANLDASDEINACSIVADATVDGKTEPWLIMFKNETHNHPTEIEPFGGAATCLGGAIRDPLSGRSYVYQAMRITGAGDPSVHVSETLPGKLPQRKITRTAAAGYSSYGNQIGLATGKVQDSYPPGFVAKRMELGAVIAAAPQANVIRKTPEPGDVILLIGGRTGRDGCGGATGSSKAHTTESLHTCGAEVQKGNPLTERNIQRLFRRAEFSTLVKRCNDFGAGGVSVAIGELAPGLQINLDLVPKKYDGLDGTELAISESQERMAVVVAAQDAEKAAALAAEENLETTAVATVTAAGRLEMSWRGKPIVSISREFLDTNGVTQHARAVVTAPDETANPFTAKPLKDSLISEWLDMLADLNVCSQQGLGERFDGTIGAATVLEPYGGKTRLTPNEAMCAKLPTMGKTDFCTLMSHGYDPYICSWSPYHGAIYSVVEALAKLAAAGGDSAQARLSFQEYFVHLEFVPERWGKPLAAVLGGLRAQLEFGTAAIGGKDSMSGTFEHLTVPPSLICFAVVPADARQVVSPEFKAPGHVVSILPVIRLADGTPDFGRLRENFARLHAEIQAGHVLAAQTVGRGGLAAALSKMCFGNLVGFNGTAPKDLGTLFTPDYGSIVVESETELPGFQVIGRTADDAAITLQNTLRLPLFEIIPAWKRPLEKIFPTTAADLPMATWAPYSGRNDARPAIRVAKPRVLIPVFPGTNCEFDTAKAFANAGAIPELVLIRNLSAADIEDSVAKLVKAIDNAQIVAFPGGFSGGDEPDGSGKFIATTFRNPRVREAMERLLKERDGLMLGICNGFQALIKLGLVPYGEIRPQLSADAPTLTFNNLGRHAATMINTVVASVKSPWLRHANVGDVHTVAISHGEGRFYASPEQVAELVQNGQVAFQYADLNGQVANEMPWNPNGSVNAIEGITSFDGRILGKMGHSERSWDTDIGKNVPGNKEQGIFRSGVEYFA